MKKNLTLSAITLLSLTCLLISCKNDPITPIVCGEIKGVVTIKGNDGVETGISKLKIYLVDTGSRPDTINVENNKILFIDSTFTDDKGNYKFSNLKEGKYGVSPFSGDSNILIQKEQSSPDPTSIIIDEQKQNYTMNFSATYPGEDYPSDITPFDLNVKFKNLTWGHYTMYIYRFEYYCFIPALSSNNRMEAGEDYQFRQGFTFPMTYGWTQLFYTLSNKFRFTFQRLGEPIIEFDYDLTLSSCPASATFEFDYAAKTFTRIK